LHQLRAETDYTAVDAVVISHFHSDHMLDLVPYRYGLLYGPASPAKPIPLWLPPGASRGLARLAAALENLDEPSYAFWDSTFEVREYDPASDLEVGDLTISFAQTQHYVPCHAMRIDALGGGTLFYSADTGAVEPLLSLAAGADVALVEATLEAAEPDQYERGHLTAHEAGLLATKAGVRQLVLTHLWVERGDHAAIEEASRAFDGQISVAKPGMTIEV
jgi:ribonuclease BN (tRNA processing enzyme)